MHDLTWKVSSNLIIVDVVPFALISRFFRYSVHINPSLWLSPHHRTLCFIYPWDTHKIGIGTMDFRPFAAFKVSKLCRTELAPRNPTNGFWEQWYQMRRLVCKWGGVSGFKTVLYSEVVKVRIAGPTDEMIDRNRRWTKQYIVTTWVVLPVANAMKPLARSANSGLSLLVNALPMSVKIHYGKALESCETNCNDAICRQASLGCTKNWPSTQTN